MTQSSLQPASMDTARESGSSLGTPRRVCQDNAPLAKDTILIEIGRPARVVDGEDVMIFQDW